MARDLNTFPILENLYNKLCEKGFKTDEDLRDIGPMNLSEETGLTPGESVQVLETVFTPKENEDEDQTEIVSTSALDLLLEENSKVPIPTFCQQLDQILGGGIRMRKVTEICGLPGSGKTQLCLQLCANVQIPSVCGGPDGEALFIDTEGSFSIERLAQIADHTLTLCQKIVHCTNPHVSLDSFSTENLLQGFHYFHCTSYTELLSILNVAEDYLILHPKISLLVVDSISFHFRYGFQEPAALRFKLLNMARQALFSLASKFGLAVVVTNQMTTKVPSMDDYGEGEEGSTVIPALGESWGHACSMRLVLSKEDRCRKASLIKSAWIPDAVAEFQITASGFRDCIQNVSRPEGKMLKNI